MLTKNQIIEIEVAAMSHEGEGIARYEGMAVFIPMTAIGDKLSAKVVKVQKNMAYAIINAILEPSPSREENACPVYRRCGGCSLRHIQYQHELAVKHQWVVDNLRRIGGIEAPFDTIIPSPQSQRYRNKAQYPVRLVDGALRLGFFSKRSHAVVPVEDCLLQPAFFGEIGCALLRFMEMYGVTAYDETAHKGVVRHLFIRHAEATGHVMVCIVINADSLSHVDKLLPMLQSACPALTTLTLNRNRERTNVILGKEMQVLHGSGTIEDEISGIRVRISPQSFYQVNRSGAELLYKAALEYANPAPEDTLLDLYCGAGVIGLSMAHRVQSVVGVEVVRQAVRDAEENARHNHITNARLLLADAAGAASQLKDEGVQHPIVLLDPPRKGVDAALIGHVAAMQPKRIVYISCNSATLARDCKAFLEHGYRVKRGRAVDLFPRTAHVETVVILSRIG